MTHYPPDSLSHCARNAEKGSGVKANVMHGQGLSPMRIGTEFRDLVPATLNTQMLFSDRPGISLRKFLGDPFILNIRASFQGWEERR